MDKNVYFYAFGGNIAFALATIYFTHFSRSISATFTNFLKAFVALFLFALTISLTSGWHSIELGSVGLLLLSGLIGLNIGDQFLFNAFKEIGPGRTLILFGFHPLLMTIFGKIFFSQEIDQYKLFAILFFILCLITFSIENFKVNKSFGIKGILFALCGMGLDAVGLVMTRYSFDSSPQMTSFEGNFYRTVGAVIGFAILTLFIRKQYFVKTFMQQKNKDKRNLLIGCFLGTYIALGLYLKAIQTGHLATISAISITGPLMATIFECFILKKRPSFYLYIAFIFFLLGSSFLF